MLFSGSSLWPRVVQSNRKYSKWFLLLFLLADICLTLASEHSKGRHQVVIAHDGFHNIKSEPKYRNWKQRQEHHVKHHNLITRTIT